MSIKSLSKMPRSSKIEIDLTGPNGNAFMLMGIASKLSKQLGIDFEPIRDQMTSGDYENLLKVFDKNFGAYVNLYR